MKRTALVVAVVVMMVLVFAMVSEAGELLSVTLHNTIVLHMFPTMKTVKLKSHDAALYKYLKFQ